MFVIDFFYLVVVGMGGYDLLQYWIQYVVFGVDDVIFGQFFVVFFGELYWIEDGGNSLGVELGCGLCGNGMGCVVYEFGYVFVGLCIDDLMIVLYVQNDGIFVEYYV